MRVVSVCALLVAGSVPVWAASANEHDGLVENSYLSCKLARDVRRRDLAQSKSAFQYYLDNKRALLAVDDGYLVDGLSAAKVKSFCAKIESDIQRQDALLVYDQAIGFCESSHVALEKGQLQQAKQHFTEYEAALEIAGSISSQAVELGHGSLQWRKCQDLAQELSEYASGTVKKIRDRLDSAYSRCLPVWAEISTTGQTSLSMEQLTVQLSALQSEHSALSSSVNSLNTTGLNSMVQEFQTCINQVEQALPQQHTQKRLSAIAQHLQRCEAGQTGFEAESKALLANKQGGVKINPQQAQLIVDAEQALEACLETKALEGPSAQPAKDHWQILNEEKIELGR